jgi:hypothetical protein
MTPPGEVVDTRPNQPDLRGLRTSWPCARGDAAAPAPLGLVHILQASVHRSQGTESRGPIRVAFCLKRRQPDGLTGGTATACASGRAPSRQPFSLALEPSDYLNFRRLTYDKRRDKVS